MKRGSKIYLFLLVLLSCAYFIFALYLRIDEQFALHAIEGLRITAHGLEYGILVFLAFLFGAVLLYFILSNAGKLSFRETYKGKSNFWITLICSLLSAAVAFFGVGYLFDPAFISNPGEAIPESEPVVINFSEEALYPINEGAIRSSESYSVSGTDQSAFVIKQSASLELNGAAIEKSGAFSGKDIFGTNAALVAGEGSTVLVSNSTIHTNADHSSALAAYKAQININQSQLSTENPDSPAVTGKESTVNLTASTLSTQASNSPVFQMEGGSITLSGGELNSQGSDSPLLAGTGSCTLDTFKARDQNSSVAAFTGPAQINMTNAIITLDGARYPCLISLKDCQDVSNLTLARSAFGPYDSLEAYGDVDFESLDLHFDQALFELENSNMNILLNEDILAFPAGVLANVISSHGSLNFNNQRASGIINVDNSSSLDINITGGSDVTTAVNAESAPVNLNLSADSILTLSGDLHLASLNDELSDYSNINFNGFTVYINGAPL